MLSFPSPPCCPFAMLLSHWPSNRNTLSSLQPKGLCWDTVSHIRVKLLLCVIYASTYMSSSHSLSTPPFPSILCYNTLFYFLLSNYHCLNLSGPFIHLFIVYQPKWNISSMVTEEMSVLFHCSSSVPRTARHSRNTYGIKNLAPFIYFLCCHDYI